LSQVIYLITNDCIPSLLIQYVGASFIHKSPYHVHLWDIVKKHLTSIIPKLILNSTLRREAIRQFVIKNEAYLTSFDIY
jgi:hypothetical protein